LTGHIYGARGVYASAEQLRTWPPHAREALVGAVEVAVRQQRAAAARKEIELRDWLAGRGTRIVELTGDEHAAFRAVAEPVLQRARTTIDDELWALLD
jgi:TRAP-type C4-dicarboxylate transport system substrate-binding protein